MSKNLLQLRLSKGLSQSEVADMLNITRQSISQWENNRTHPDIDKLLELSQIYGISIKELIEL